MLFTYIFIPYYVLGADPQKGKVYGDVFLNYNYNLENNQSSYRLNRLHLGYRYDYSENLFFNGMVESAIEDYVPATQPQGSEYNQITNLFELCLGFKFKLIEGKVGLIGTELNQQQEKLWRHRHIDKVFADKYGYAPTNDFGILVKYKPSDLLLLDFSMTNGEGHKSLQRDSVFRYALGGTFFAPAGIVGRIYTDFVNYPSAYQMNMIGILGYQNDLLSAGVEYNFQQSFSGMKDYNKGGLSVYASVNLLEKYNAFGRYDKTFSEIPATTSVLNPFSDSELFILGIQRNINKNINLALDYRKIIFEDQSIDDSLIFCSMEITF
jgi:hypothetical protein